jgi:small subunit ribosomal protein S6
LAVNVYEGMFILDSNRYARDPGGVPRQIDELIEKHGGEMLVSRLWVEQKLAFPIKGQSKGTYWLTYFRLDSGQLQAVNHQVKLNDNVLRSLVLKIDPRLVDAMVAHAMPGSSSAATDDTKKPGQEEKALPEGASEGKSATAEAGAAKP